MKNPFYQLLLAITFCAAILTVSHGLGLSLPGPQGSPPVTSAAPSGAAGGKLAGTYPNPTLNAASTDLTDTANVALLNAANVFSNMNTIGGTNGSYGGDNYTLLIGTNTASLGGRIAQKAPSGFATYNAFYEADVLKWYFGNAGSALSPASSFAIADGSFSTNTRFCVAQGGNIGIGTTAPTTILDVAGVCRSQGTLTNDAASFGYLGEFVQTLVASGAPVSFSTGTAKDICFISLSTGDWDVEGNANIAGASVTQTAAQAGINTTSATLPTDGSEVYSGIQGNIILAETDSITLPRKRISITSTAHTGLTGVASTDVITDTGNGYANGDTLYFTAIAGGAGLTINTMYYVVSVATNTYKLSATSGGAAIDFTTNITSGTIKKGANVFLTAKVTFSAGTETGFGQINARRVR